MVQAIFDYFAPAVELTGMAILLLGCFVAACAVFSGQVLGIVKGCALIAIGSCLAGLLGIPH